jgi:hypothetical protein
VTHGGPLRNKGKRSKMQTRSEKLGESFYWPSHVLRISSVTKRSCCPSIPKGDPSIICGQNQGRRILKYLPKPAIDDISSEPMAWEKPDSHDYHNSQANAVSADPNAHLLHLHGITKHWLPEVDIVGRASPWFSLVFSALDDRCQLDLESHYRMSNAETH